MNQRRGRAAAAATAAPVAAEPVRVMKRVVGWRASAAPVLAPGPKSTFSTPSGVPASRHTSNTRRAVAGANEAGLTTRVLPVTRAALAMPVN